MPLYENSKCPVCGIEFEENDDVVFCPECGTPHHRECYNLIGHCVNRGLHKEGYSYYNEHKKDSPSYSAEPKSPADEANDENSPPPFFVSLNGIPDFSSPYDKDEEKIDGESTGDVAAVIRTNVARFISIFKEQEKTKRKASWNWGAFFFGAYYFFFRKMYKQGIILACVNFAVSFASDFLITKFAPAAAELLGKVQSLMLQYKFDEATSSVNQLKAASDIKTLELIMFASSAVSILITVLTSVYADYFYKKTVTSVIKTVSSRLEEGAAFQSSPLAGDRNLSLSQDQMRRIYLARKGGTSLLAPMAAFLLIETIITFL